MSHVVARCRPGSRCTPPGISLWCAANTEAVEPLVQIASNFPNISKILVPRNQSASRIVPYFFALRGKRYT